MQPEWQDLIDQTVQDETLRHAYAWAPFVGGSSNSIFLGHLKQGHDATGVIADQTASGISAIKTVILRVNAPAKDTPGVSRQREATILDWIKPFDWAPQIIRNEPEQGWCLMHYYEDALKTEKEASKSLPTKFHNLLLHAVDDLHTIDIDSDKDDLTTNYEILLNEAYLGIAEAKKDTQALTWIQSIKNDLAALPKLPQCLVHHDLHIDNLIVSASTDNAVTNHSLTILDWEYASIGSPWFDASCLSRYLSIPANKIHKLTRFETLDETTFEAALKRANGMTKTLQELWHRTRE